MATCKITGLPLPANLYSDPLGRPNKYRYRLPNGKFKPVNGDYSHACDVANAANDKRDSAACSSKSTMFWVSEYIKWMERSNPDIIAKASWQNRCSSLRTFAKEVSTPIAQISVSSLSEWWDGLTYDQQHNRRSNYSQFFQWAISKGAATCNPFNTSDAAAHLIKKKKPTKRRLPIEDMNQFWAIYNHASDHIQIAMMISLTTTMRIGDIATLKFSDIQDTPNGKKLCKTISKSASQRGVMAATNNAWYLNTHTKLAETINEARQLSMMHMRCPYIVSKSPRSTKSRRGCTNAYQVTRDDLTRGFRKAVDACGIWASLPPGRTPPTFHEVRGLSIDLLLRNGSDIQQVQKLAAHTDSSVTSGYTANHPPEYVDWGIVVSDEVLR